MTAARFFSEKLPYPDAANYLENLPNDLKTVFSNHLGGTLSAAEFKKLMPPGFSGIMAWFCLDTSEPLSPKVFLAFESKTNFTYPEDADAIEALKPSGLLLTSSQLFSTNIGSISDYNAFLKTHNITPPETDKYITSKYVTDFNDNYKKSTLIKRYQKFAHGYFENNDNLVSLFLTQADVKYVRYYFGFHSTTETNKIRVMIAPVDKDGTNISVKPDGTAASFIQKSVPPPPR